MNAPLFDNSGARRKSGWVVCAARVARDARKAEYLDIEIRNGCFHSLAPPGKEWPRDRALDLRGHLIMPGLINAHDHLEFNLFPRLGKGPYPNASDWARDIYHPERPPVREHLRVPLEARLFWGGVKNLLEGVTSVCHHNPYDARVFENNFPVRVLKDFGWAHSLEFTPHLLKQFQITPPDHPFIVHLAEATDAESSLEIFRLESLGALDARTVIVHGVGLNKSGLRLMQRKRASVIWCPSSNVFVLGRTLARSVFRRNLPVALGTDSSLTGTGRLLRELRAARRYAALPQARLYDMVTLGAARVLRLKEGQGSIRVGGVADFLAVKDRGRSPAATLLRTKSCDIELVVLGGKIKLISPKLSRLLDDRSLRNLQPIAFGSERPVLVDADIIGHYRTASKTLGPGIRLAGRSFAPAKT